MEIDTNAVYKALKKQNGERFAKEIRSACLLDTPNLLQILKRAGNNPSDAQELLDVLHELHDKSLKNDKKYAEIDTGKDPITLLNEAGYHAFYVNTSKELNSICKYFDPDEELCSFGTQKYKCFHIIHAVKYEVLQDANAIARGFPPRRQDAYGTSVISIHIPIRGGYISIKNRYNHSVNNPDATFDNEPNNIIPGLKTSLKKQFGVDFITFNAPVPSDYVMIKNQLIKYVYYIKGMWFANDCYVTNTQINEINKDYELLFEGLILDLRKSTKDKPVQKIRNLNKTSDLYKVFKNEIGNSEIKITKTPDDTHIVFIKDKTEFKELCRVKNSRLTHLHLYKTTTIGHNFLKNNDTLQEFVADNLHSIGKNFLIYNMEELVRFSAPKLKKIGNEFLVLNQTLNTFQADNLQEVGYGFLQDDMALMELYLPNLQKAGDGFLTANNHLKIFSADNLQEVGNKFLCNNLYLTELNLPNVKKIGNFCLSINKNIKKFKADKLQEIGKHFLCENEYLTELELPELRKIEENFLSSNKLLQKLNTPKLESFNDFILLDSPKQEEFLSYLEHIVSINKAVQDIKIRRQQVLNQQKHR